MGFVVGPVLISSTKSSREDNRNETDVVHVRVLFVSRMSDQCKGNINTIALRT